MIFYLNLILDPVPENCFLILDPPSPGKSTAKADARKVALLAFHPLSVALTVRILVVSF